MHARSPKMLTDALAGPAPLTFPQLQAALDGASPATTSRYLRSIPYLRSYNHNGRFYTHADPRRFDHFGLFRLDSACFSRDGSLTATVTRLVQEAEAGWTHKELRSLLHVPSHACLLSAVRNKRIRRERSDGVYLYLSADPEVAERQRQARRSRGREARAGLAADLDPSLVIEVLLALIRNPNSSTDQLARRLRGHSPPIRLHQITAVLQRFDLEQVAKNGGLQPADPAADPLPDTRLAQAAHPARPAATPGPACD